LRTQWLASSDAAGLAQGKTKPVRTRILQLDVPDQQLAMPRLVVTEPPHAAKQRSAPRDPR